MTTRWLTIPLLFALAAMPCTADEPILLDPESKERIELAKSRLTEMSEYLEEAKELGLGDDFNDEFDKGIKTAKYAKDGLDLGVKTLGYLDKLIKLHTNLSCLSQATACMSSDERSTGCVRAYAFGMSTLFSDIHSAIDGEEFEWSFATAKVNLALAMYSGSLKVAAETFARAETWGQICKTREICEMICSSPENAALFDCVELLNEDPPMPPMCETLKDIVEGKQEQKTAEELIEIELEAQHNIKHHSKNNLDSGFVQLSQFLDSARSNLDGGFGDLTSNQRNRMRSQIARARSRLESAKAEVDALYPTLHQAQQEEDLQAMRDLRPPMQQAVCKLQKAARDVYSVTRNQPGEVKFFMTAAQGIAACNRYDEYTDDVDAIKRVN